MPEDQIAEIVRQLHETVTEPQETKHREVQLKLLRHMRL
jgi:hypothetical protein